MSRSFNVSFVNSGSTDSDLSHVIRVDRGISTSTPRIVDGGDNELLTLVKILL